MGSVEKLYKSYSDFPTEQKLFGMWMVLIARIHFLRCTMMMFTRKKGFLLLLAVGLLYLAMPAKAQEVTPNGFLVELDTKIEVAPDMAYRIFVKEVGKWWNPDHTYTLDAGNMSINPIPGGCLCESFPDGGGVEHLRVVYVAPGKSVRFAGGLGPLQMHGIAGSMTWDFTEEAEVTRVKITYSVGGFWPGGFEKIAPPVQYVVNEQMTRLKAYAETGKPD